MSKDTSILGRKKRLTDIGYRSKKTGRPSGQTNFEIRAKYESILRLMITGEEPDFIPLSLTAACKRFGTNTGAFYIYTRRNPDFKKKYDDVRAAMAEVLGSEAELNLKKALDGTYKNIDETNKARLSLDVLKATSPNYNQKLKIEADVNNVMIGLSNEEIEERLKNLILTEAINEEID